jgi:hypothetical protein
MNKSTSIIVSAVAAVFVAGALTPHAAIAGGARLTGGNVTLQAGTPGSVETGNFNISGKGIAGSFKGSGSELVNLNASAVTTGTLSELRLPLSTPRTTGTNVWTGQNTFSSTLNSFTGSGAGLTSLNATNLSSGTINVNRIPTSIPRLASNNVFTGTGQFTRIGLGTASVPDASLVATGLLRTNSFLDVRNSAGTVSVAQWGRDNANNGIGLLFTAAGTKTVEMLGRVGNNPGGSIGLFNTSNVLRATFGIDSSGGSVLACNVKNFVCDNPQDPSTHIYYAAVEGPEVAAYTRGKATLHNGEATIELPDHFASITDEDSITVQLTPRSASSKGLAAVEVSGGRIIVRELMNGTGDYAFDWRVEGVRKGYENYRVVRPKHELQTGIITTTEGLTTAPRQ